MRTDEELVSAARALAGAAPSRLERRGGRAFLEVGDRVVWLPLDDVGAQEIAREDAVLAALPAPAPVQFPRVLSTGPQGSLRTRVKGFPALEVQRALLDNELRTRALAVELAGVAVWLHRLELPLELPPARFVEAEVNAGCDAIAAFDPGYGQRAHGLLAPEQAHLDGACVLHWDFGSHNLLLDSRGHVCALLDFADARRGDRHFEMRWLPSYGELFLGCFVNAYRRASGTSLDAYRVRRLHALAALEQLGWGVREPEQHHRTGRTLEQTREWACAALDALELAG